MAYQWHYQMTGDRRLPVVLFLHGFMGSHRDFAATIEPLSQEFCCLSIDLPGHGQTRVSGDVNQYGMVPTATALVELLQTLKISKAFLVGYSMGGRLALYLALHYPQQFSRVILESASPGLASETERQQRSQRDWQLADQLEADFTSFLQHWYEQPLFHSLRHHPDFPRLLQQRAQNNPAELANSLRYLSTGQQPSLWQSLETLPQPLLLLAGERDSKFVGLNQAMACHCPQAQLTIVPECGHGIHWEQPERFTRVVREFLTYTH